MTPPGMPQGALLALQAAARRQAAGRQRDIYSGLQDDE